MGFFGFGKKDKAVSAEELAIAEEEKKKQAEIERLEEQRERYSGFVWPEMPRLNVFASKNSAQEDFEDCFSAEDKERIGQIAFAETIGTELLKGLNLQEVLYLEAVHGLLNKQAPLENYEQNHRGIHNRLLSLVREADKLYMIYDLKTGYPLIDCGYAQLYLDETHAETAAKAYEKQLRKVRVISHPGISAEPEKKDGKEQMKLFDYLYFLGLEGIMIDNGWYKGYFSRSEVSAPFYLNQEPEKIPPHNPAVSFILIDYVGELRWGVNYEKRTEIIQAKFRTIMETIQKGVYIIPAVQNVSDKGEEQKISFPAFPLAEKKFLPVFTDVFEYGKYFGQPPYRPTRAPFQLVAQLTEKYDGFIINPQGQAFIVERRSPEQEKTDKEKG